MQKQNEFNETIGGESCSARWIWESGKLKNGGMAVPWEIQVVNTCSENFTYDSSDNTYVVCQTPGLYEISYGFFAAKKPTVQLLINGEPVISMLNPQTSKSGEFKTGNVVYHHQKTAAMSGMTHRDFLALPPTA